MRAKTQMLNKPEDGTLGKIWNYHCKNHSLKDCFDPEFFIPLKDHFLAGDRIFLIQTNEHGHVVKSCETMVVYNKRDENQIMLRPTGDIKDYFYQKPEEPKPEPPPPVDEFIKGNGEVKFNKKTKKHDVLVNGEVVYSDDDLVKAASVARGDEPLN